MAKRAFLKENYIVVDLDNGDPFKYFPRGFAFVRVTSTNYQLFGGDLNQGSYQTFLISDSPNWFAEDGTTAYDSDTLLTFLLTNTGFSTAEGSASTTLAERVIVTQDNVATTLGGTIDSTKQYFIDGDIDFSGVSIEVPATGIFIRGYNLDLSIMRCADASYTMFTSPGGGSGNVFITDLSIEVTGSNSQVFDLTDATGFNAAEFNLVNFNDCVGLGEITRYRQVLENGTGRFGGTPELTLSGTWVGGYRVSTSIVRSINNISSLFRQGAGLTFDGRFIIEINCDLPTTGNLIDFQDTAFSNDESLQLRSCRITRNGVLDSSDANISPNIDEKSVKSLWSDNSGVPNTQKYLRQVITTEVATTINTAGVYEVLAGTFTVDSDPSHFDSPVNGQIRLLSGNGKYQIFGNLIIDGGANDVVDIRVTRSTDGGVTFPTVINHVRRQINSLVGGRDVAFFDINFLTTLEEGDRIRMEIENVTDTTNVTAELDSTLIVTAI